MATVLSRRNACVSARRALVDLGAGLFVLAVATRETAVTLPAALLLCELCRGERPPGARSLRRQWPHWVLLLAGRRVPAFQPALFRPHRLRLRRAQPRRQSADAGRRRVLSGAASRQRCTATTSIPALPTLDRVDACARLSSCAWRISRPGHHQPAAAPMARVRHPLVLPAARADQLASCRGSTWPTTGSSTSRAGALFRPLRCSSPPVELGLRAIAAAACVRGRQRRAPARLPRRDHALGSERARVAVEARAHNNLGYAYYQAGRKAEAWREIAGRPVLRSAPGQGAAEPALPRVDSACRPSSTGSTAKRATCCWRWSGPITHAKGERLIRYGDLSRGAYLVKDGSSRPRY